MAHLASSFGGYRATYDEAAPLAVATHVAVTQATNITTAVTANAIAGTITTQDASAAAGASQTFTVNNTQVKPGCIVLAQIQDYAGTMTTNGLPMVTVDAIVDNTSFNVTISNAHGSNALDGALQISFVIVYKSA